MKEVTEKLEKYDIVSAARILENFAVEDVSHWYIRRIREHMKNARSTSAKECSRALGFVLLEFSKALAPFAPFIAEGIYKGSGGKKESVHLEDWPAVSRMAYGVKLIKDMEKVREIVSKALEARQKAGIKIRQPLASLELPTKDYKLSTELLDLIKGEVNVKKITFGDNFELDAKISEELKEEGLVREFIRQVQDFRKELKLKPQEKVELSASGEKSLEKILQKHEKLIKKEIALSEFEIGKGKGHKKELKLGDSVVEVYIS